MVYWVLVAAYGIVVVTLLVAAQKRHRANRALLLRVTQSSRDQMAELTELSGQVGQLLQTLQRGVERLGGNRGSSSDEFDAQAKQSGGGGFHLVDYHRQNYPLTPSLFAEPLVVWLKHTYALSSGTDTTVVLGLLKQTRRGSSLVVSHRQASSEEPHESRDLMREWWDESLRSSSIASPWTPSLPSSMDTQAEPVRARILTMLLAGESTESLERSREEQTSRQPPRPWVFARSRVYKSPLLPKRRLSHGWTVSPSWVSSGASDRPQ